MFWPEWFNPLNWDKQSRSWLAQLKTDASASVPSEWMPFSDLAACGQCNAGYNLYRRPTDFYPPSDIQRIRAKALARIRPIIPTIHSKSMASSSGNRHPNRWMPNLEGAALKPRIAPPCGRREEDFAKAPNLFSAKDAGELMDVRKGYLF
jgi:hypothetical protein